MNKSWLSLDCFNVMLVVRVRSVIEIYKYLSVIEELNSPFPFQILIPFQMDHVFLNLYPFYKRHGLWKLGHMNN